MAASVVIDYSVPGDSVCVRNRAARVGAAECVEEHVDEDLHLWRAPGGPTVMVELFGWSERRPEEWRALFPADMALDEGLVRAIRRAVAREMRRFLASKRYPEYAEAIALRAGR